MQWTYREKRNDQEQWCTLGGGVWDVNARLSECLVPFFNVKCHFLSHYSILKP